MYWQLSDRFHKPLVRLADKHYSRQKPGTNQFVPPGTPLCLLGRNKDAGWVTLEQKPEYQDHDWKGAWNNCFFLNDNSGELSSELIIQACAVTRYKWGVNPNGIITMIDTKKVKWKKHFGYCYRKAGFVKVGETKVHKLLVLKLFAEGFPPPMMPRSPQNALFENLTESYEAAIRA
jgi:hypothetical protein